MIFSRSLVRTTTQVAPRRLYNTKIDIESLVSRLKKSKEESLKNQTPRFGQSQGQGQRQRFGNRPPQGNRPPPKDFRQNRPNTRYPQGNSTNQGVTRNEFNRSNNSDQRPLPNERWRRNREPLGPEIPKWEYGTDLEKEYMNHVFKQIYEVNEEGLVLFINDSGELEEGTVLRYVDLVPKDHVIGIVDKQEQRGEMFTLVKILPRRAKLQEYSDKMAENKTKLYGRGNKKPKNKDASLKHIKISWEISQSDLDNQKTNEVISQLKKGFKILLVIGQRRDIGAKRFSFDELSQKKESELSQEEKEKLEEIENEQEEGEEEFQALNHFEQTRRNKVLEQVKAIFEERSKYTVKGDIRSRIVINAEPLETVTPEKKEDEKKKLKEQKKLERQLKEKQRLEKKKAKMESQKNQTSTLL